MFAPPESVGAFKVLRELGQGGMGRVFLGERKGAPFRQLVAIKLLSPHLQETDLVARFESERRILAALDHPNIAMLIDGGETPDGIPYVVLEHVDGLPIDEFVRKNQLSLKELLSLMQTVCAAVEAAHRSLIVHRDIKPSNVFVTHKGVVKLLDFGIAKNLSLDEAMVQTRTGMHAMTPGYASPEQLLGKPLTTATDVYSLGCLLYRLVTGRLPHGVDGLTPAAAAQVVLEDSAEFPSSALEKDRVSNWTPGMLRGDIDRIVMKALHQEPARRYASAQALGDDLQRLLSGMPVEARPDGFRYVAGKFIWRHRIASALVSLLFVGLLGSLGVSVSQGNLAKREKEQARIAYQRSQAAFRFISDTLGQVKSGTGEATTVLEAIDRVAGQVEEKIADPFTEMATRVAIGRIYDGLGKPGSAVQQLEIAKGLLTPDTPEVEALSYDIDWLLTWNYYLTGKFSEVVAVGTPVVESGWFLEGHSQVHFNVVGAIASAKAELGDYEGAIATLRRHIVEVEEFFSRLQLYNMIAVLEMGVGNLEEAEMILRDTLAFVDTGDPGRLQRDVITYNLSVVESLLGRHEVAHESLTALLGRLAEYEAEDSINVANAEGSLGFNHLLAGRADVAVKWLRSALNKYTAELPDDWRTHSARVALGIALRETNGGNGAAQRHIEEGLRGLRRTAEPENPWRRKLEALASL
ncbi:MAG: serine/threonine-protein kinase [Pseudomonadota bacterium]